MERNPFYGKLLRSSSSRPFPRLCVPSVALNPISLTNADCVHHAFEEIGLIKKSFPFREINFPKIKFFSELRQAPPLWASLKYDTTELHRQEIQQIIILIVLKRYFVYFKI